MNPDAPIKVVVAEVLLNRLLHPDAFMRDRGPLTVEAVKTELLPEIEKALDRDTFLEADEALTFGLVDKVFERRPDNDKTTPPEPI